MVADRREFIRLDVGYFDNPKVADALDDHPVAVLAHIASMAYARQHRTDGVVPVKRILRKVGATESDARALVKLGLWVELDESRIEVHDYAKHQETRDEIEARSKKQSENARKRWESRRDATRNADGTFRASGNATGIAERTASGNAEESRGEERREEGPVVTSPERQAARDAHYEDDRNPMEGTSPKTVFPRGFSASTRHKAYAMENGLNIGEELTRFREHARANGRAVVDWGAAFNLWLMDSAKRSKADGGKRPGSSVWDRDTTGGDA
jgi:hypothetical protein